MRHSLALFAALVCSAAPAAAATYTFDIVASNDGSGAFNTFLTGSINSFGTVALPYKQPGTGPFTGNRVATIDTAGEIATFAPFSVGPYQTPTLNDADQIVAVRTLDGNGRSGRQLVRIEADNTITVLADVDNNTPALGNVKSFGRYSVNSSGEVAAELTTLDGKDQIVRFTADGSGWTVIHEISPDLQVLSPPDINDSGVVAFSASTGGSNSEYGVYLGDGTAPVSRAVNLTGVIGTSGVRPDLNNDGDILISGGNRLVKWEVGHAETDVDIIVDLPTGSGLPNIQRAWHNTSDEIAYILGKYLYLNGERVIGEGDLFEGGTIGAGGSGLQVSAIDGLSEGGFVMIGVSTDHIGPSGNADRFVVRVNPEGTAIDNPELPEATLQPGDPGNPTSRVRNIVPIFVRDVTPPPAVQLIGGPITRTNCGRCLWIDPVVATGFVYSLEAGAPNFASITLPDPLGISDSLLTLEFMFGGVLQSFDLTPGDTFYFTYFTPEGISEFSLLGIDPGAGADPDLPFTVGLTFVENGFRGNMFIDAITVDTDNPDAPSIVPLPANLPFLLSGLGAIALLRRRRRA